MSLKHIMNTTITLRLVELLKEHSPEETVKTLSKEITDCLNCEPFEFIIDKKDIYNSLENISTILKAELKNISDNKPINKKSIEVSQNALENTLEKINKMILKDGTKSVNYVNEEK